MFIKPSSPTPNHKKHVKLSLLDQLSPSFHVKLVLFYNPPLNNIKKTRLQLANSLSETLTYFYPYAGRIIDNASIECTDEGVMYAETEVEGEVEEVLSKRDPETVKMFLPDVIGFDGLKLKAIPLLIKVSFFECGGVAIGVLANHRIMDGVALSIFIQSWAAISSGSDSGLNAPDFTTSSVMYPPSDLFNTIPERSPILQPEDICVTKTYIFDATTIAAIKEKLGNKTIQPTRVEAVSSLVWKCTTKSSSSPSSSIWTHSVNTRKRLDPPLPDNTPGNHAISFSVHSVSNDDDDDDDDEKVRVLVHLLRHGLREFCENGQMKRLKDELPSVRCSAILDLIQEGGERLKGKDSNVFFLTSWCGFRLYDADFGWGKPEWIGFPSFPYKNLFVLMDTKEENGIEAWITLGEDHMAAFEHNLKRQLS